VIVSALVMGEQISNLEAFGYTGLLICAALYIWLKATEKQATEEPPSAAESSYVRLMPEEARARGFRDDEELVMPMPVDDSSDEED
jgi:hypothetical protein